MNLNHLAIFHAVAEEKSVTRAADRLLISQPAISKQLRLLEKSLGTQLFDRLPRGVRPTQAGSLLATYAKRLFSIADEAELAISQFRGLHSGRLRVGASTTLGIYLLPELFLRFRQQHPGIQLHLEIAPSDTLATRLIDGTIDIAFTEGSITGDSFHSTTFDQDQLIPIARPKHPLAHKRNITIQTLAKESFIVRETTSGTQSLIEQHLSRRGITIAPAMSFPTTEAIKQAVTAGVGIAIVSKLSVTLELQTKKLIQLQVKDLKITRPLHRVTASQSHPTPALTALLNQLEKSCHNKATR